MSKTQSNKQASAPDKDVVTVRSLVGDFVILSQDVRLVEGKEALVRMDPHLQSQIDAGKVEIVSD